MSELSVFACFIYLEPQCICSYSYLFVRVTNILLSRMLCEKIDQSLAFTTEGIMLNLQVLTADNRPTYRSNGEMG